MIISFLVSVLVIIGLLYILEEIGIVALVIIVVGFFIAPTMIEHTNNSCQSVKVLTYRSQPGNKTDPIPADVFTKLLTDGNTTFQQSGEVRCSLTYWDLVLDKEF